MSIMEDNSMEKWNEREPHPKGIWSPLAVGMFCFIFSFLAAGIMNAVSYGRMGDHAEKQKRLALVLGAFIVFIILAFVTPEASTPLFTGFHIATILYFRFEQEKVYERHLANGGKKAGIVKPLLLSIIGAIAFFSLITILFV